MRTTKPSARRIALPGQAVPVVLPFASVSVLVVLALVITLVLAPVPSLADDRRAAAVAGMDATLVAGGADTAAVPDEAHDCLVEPHVTADVGSAVQGIVARLLVERGDTVTRGQPLAELESGVERAVLAEAEARVEMQSEVASREADLALARLDKTRFERLHARRLAPEQQRDEASARYQVASAALVQALENRKLAHFELQRVRRQLEQRTVRSPIDGVVVRHHLFPGELVHGEPVTTVAGLDPLRVEVVLPARLFGTVRRGDAAWLFLELDDGTPLPARVDVADPLLDTRSGTFGARLLLPNPDHAITAGQKCRVAFDERVSPEAVGDGAPIAAALPVPETGPRETAPTIDR